jgi:glucose/arabinose dehydrogenase
MLNYRRVALGAIPAVFSLLLSACPQAPQPTTTRMELPEPVTPHQGVALDLQTIASGLPQPVFLTSGVDSNVLFVALQGGQIRLIVDDVLSETPFLDLAPVLGTPSEGGGLIGLALHPNYKANGRLYVHYITEAGDSVIARYTRSQCCRSRIRAYPAGSGSAGRPA